MSDFSIDSLVSEALRNNSSDNLPPFWENYQEDGEILSTDHKGMSTYKVRVPDSKQFVVVKPKDVQSKNGNDPRKTAIFQEIASYYGMLTVPEVTIERDGKAIRIAEYVPGVDLASSIDGNREENLTLEEKELVETWFPSTIFDDSDEIMVHNGGEGRYSMYNPITINKITLSTNKFEAWYARTKGKEKERVDASLKSIHEMVSDGFLMDLFGKLNLAFHQGEFILVDVEPLQLSNATYLKPATVNYSEALLNRMFAIVGLPTISYAEIVQRNYGEDKFLETRSEFNPQCSDGTLKSLRTNVTSSEELKLYEQRLKERKDG